MKKTGENMKRTYKKPEIIILEKFEVSMVASAGASATCAPACAAISQPN